MPSSVKLGQAPSPLHYTTAKINKLINYGRFQSIVNLQINQGKKVISKDYTVPMYQGERFIFRVEVGKISSTYFALSSRQALHVRIQRSRCRGLEGETSAGHISIRVAYHIETFTNPPK